MVHDSAPSAYILNKKEGFVTYAEPLDHPQTMNGEHYIGIFMPASKTKVKSDVKYLPLGEKRAGGIGHAILQTTYTPGKPFVYYAGSSWSLYDIPTHAIWQQTLRHEAAIQGKLQVEHFVLSR